MQKLQGSDNRSFLTVTLLLTFQIPFVNFTVLTWWEEFTQINTFKFECYQEDTSVPSH